MKLDYYLTHLYGTKMSRRKAMRTTATIGGAAGALMTVGSSTLHTQIVDAARASVRELTHRPFVGSMLQQEPLNDAMFDVAAVEAGAWAPGPYGVDDERGSFNEITPLKTASALRLLDTGKPVVTYNLGEMLFNGFPAFVTTPPRVYDQVMRSGGYPKKPGYQGFNGGDEPAAANKISGNEERFPNSGTYQIGTQLDNLNHVGVGNMFYNGFRGTGITESWGTIRLGGENMGPFITRGIVLDILGLKVSQGATGDYFTAPNGARVLRDNYRITVEDIQEAMRRQGTGDVTPGDVVLLREGWTHLVRTDPTRYLAQEPGIYLREVRYLAPKRPALIGSDSWGLEVLDPTVTGGNAFPCHQMLFGRYGVRIGEGIVTEKLVEDGVFEFVYICTPQSALGSTAGNTPPAALGQRRA